MNPRLICVGHVALDMMFGVQAFPAHPTKTPAHHHHQGVGGMSANAAVALARLGLSPARLWLLDEPFVALDSAACGVLQGLMQTHVTRGGMVVFTSHQAVNLASGDNRSHRLGRV